MDPVNVIGYPMQNGIPEADPQDGHVEDVVQDEVKAALDARVVHFVVVGVAGGHDDGGEGHGQEVTHVVPAGGAAHGVGGRSAEYIFSRFGYGHAEIIY